MRSKRNAGFVKYLILSLLVAGIFSLLGQEKKEPVKPEPEKTPTSSNNTAVMALQDFNPMSHKDPRLKISKLNFDRRYAATGLGEFGCRF